MDSSKNTAAHLYFPAIICLECDSPIDALIALCVPRDEAMDSVAASWHDSEFTCVITTIDGGRTVAALRMPTGRWAACNAFMDFCCSTQKNAERQLQKLLKRGRHGIIGVIAPTNQQQAAYPHTEQSQINTPP